MALKKDPAADAAKETTPAVATGTETQGPAAGTETPAGAGADAVASSELTNSITGKGTAITDLTKPEKTQEEALAEARALIALSDQQDMDNADAVAVQEGRQPLELKLVLVENLTHAAFRQHSTGKWIYGKTTEHLLNDGWLSNQIKAKLLALVKE